MIVTFAGGSLHGTHELRDEAPPRITVFDDDGKEFVYELRQQSGGAAGNQQIIWSHTTYAPVGLSIGEFFELVRGVYPPLHLSDG